MDRIHLTMYPVSPDAHQLSEISQYMDIKFAFTNANYEQVHRECKCRDFLGDMIWSRVTGNKVSVYGIEYDYSDHPYDVDVTRFSLRFPRAEAMENFIKNFSFLTDKEEALGISKSVLFEADQLNTLIIESDKIWQSNNWKLSLYTYYIKCMGYPEIGKYQGPEARYTDLLQPEIEKVLLSHIKTQMSDTIRSLYSSHNNSGFIALIATSVEPHPARKVVFKNYKAAA